MSQFLYTIEGVINIPKRLTTAEFQTRVDEYTNGTLKVIGEYINKRTAVLVECNICHHQWEVSPASFVPSSTKEYHYKGCPYCKYVTLKCEYCGKEFQRLKSEINSHNFCSKTCGNRYKNLDTTNWNNSINYRRNAFATYPHKCHICNWDKDERVLEVHHIDENRDNNDISNLVILCPTCHKFLTLHLYTLQELKNK